jgi:osmoprotectant transport system substrate-binding protein
MEDFARFANSGGRLRLAASSEFVDSPAALPAFQRTYNFKLAREQIQLKPGGESLETMHAAVESEQGVNCAMVYGTDGTVEMSGLVLMADSKGAQIAYQPSAVIRATVLEKFPALGPPISKAFRFLTIARLRKMNIQIAKEGRSPREVARDYLIAQRVLH